MTRATRPLPHWTWDDLETALSGFDQTRQLETLRLHLLEGLQTEAESADAPDLLKHVLSAGWVLAQVGVSATDPRQEAGRSALSS
jgi:hypothetical protein